jgi:hypothetical protein
MAAKTGKWKISDEEFERQYAEATRRGKEELAKGTHAIAARYDKASKRIVVELANGASLMIPARLIEGLQKASPKNLSEIEILGAGSGLYWPNLEIDIGIAGLLKGIFGTKAWMAELGRTGGKATTEAKRTASRANGKLGGRPRAKPIARENRAA